MSVKIVTHQNMDFDGAAGIEKLRRFGETKIPGINQAKVIYWSGDTREIPKMMNNRKAIIFVDICPQGVVNDPKQGIYVYDHHPHEQFPNQTAASLIDKDLGLIDPKNLKMTEWSKRADFRAGGDPMNVANIMKELHLTFSDEEILRWFCQLAEAHFQADEGKVDWQKGTEFFMNSLKQFLSKNKQSPAKTVISRWIERKEKAIEDEMNIATRTIVNSSVLGPETTRKWLMTVLKGVDRGQQLFREAAKEFEKAKKIIVGEKVIVVGRTNNPRFNRYCRSEPAKKLMPRALSKREDPIVLQFQGKGFQIYTNKSGYKLFDIVGALRAEILKARNKKIPPNWKILKQGGTLRGTEPLYYQVGGGYEVVMWGSLTAPGVKPMDISVETIERVVLTVIDPNYFPPECQESCYKECSLYPWQMWRCRVKKRQTHKS